MRQVSELMRRLGTPSEVALADELGVRRDSLNQWMRGNGSLKIRTGTVAMQWHADNCARQPSDPECILCDGKAGADCALCGT